MAISLIIYPLLWNYIWLEAAIITIVNVTCDFSVELPKRMENSLPIRIL